MPYSIYPGTPERVDLILSKLREPKVVLEKRLIRVVTGWYDNIRVTAGSIGYTSPHAALALEIFLACGVKLLIGVGSAGGL